MHPPVCDLELGIPMPLMSGKSPESPEAFSNVHHNQEQIARPQNEHYETTAENGEIVSGRKIWRRRNCSVLSCYGHSLNDGLRWASRQGAPRHSALSSCRIFLTVATPAAVVYVLLLALVVKIVFYIPLTSSSWPVQRLLRSDVILNLFFHHHVHYAYF